MPKFNFELLLKSKNQEGISIQPVGDLITSRKELSFKKESDKVLVYDCAEDISLEFRIAFHKKENFIFFRLKALTSVSWQKSYCYDEFRNRIISLLRSEYEVTLMTRELSHYYATKCYPILYDYEGNLRKLFYLLFNFNEISDGNKVIRRKKLTSGKLNSFVEDLDLSELERLLFEKIWLLKQNGDYEYCDISDGGRLIEKMMSLAYKPEFKSTWELFLQPLLVEEYVDKARLKAIRDIRNKVSHHKEMSFDDWKYCRREVRQLSNVFRELQQKIMMNEFYSGVKFDSIRSALSLLSSAFAKQQKDMFEKITEPLKSINKMFEGLTIPKFEMPALELAAGQKFKEISILTTEVFEKTSQSGMQELLQQQIKLANRLMLESINIPKLEVPHMTPTVLQNLADVSSEVTEHSEKTPSRNGVQEIFKQQNQLNNSITDRIKSSTNNKLEDGGESDGR